MSPAPSSRPSATAATSPPAGGVAVPRRSLGRVPPALRLLHQWAPLPAPARHPQRHLVLRSAPPGQPRPRPGWLVHAGGTHRAAQARRGPRPRGSRRPSPSPTAFRSIPSRSPPFKRPRRPSPRAGARCCSPWPPAPARPRPALRSSTACSRPSASAACSSWSTAPPSASRPPTPSKTRAWRACRPSPTSSASRSWRSSSPTPTPPSTSPPCRAWSSASSIRPRTSTPPAVDRYDCIVVDECHRGYLLDRELSDTELGFRSFDDYISKYRRVLEYFDAVKIGLTATPALHTTEIFGPPIYTYSYREAVIDGYLIDHEPPVQIQTELSTDGIVWKVGDEVAVYDATRNQIDLFTRPGRDQDRGRGLQPKGHHRVVQSRRVRVPGPGARSGGPREDPHLLRQRRPRRPGRRPAQTGLRGPVRQRRRRRRAQDHRRRGQAAPAHPPLQERAPAQRRRHRRSADHRHRRAARSATWCSCAA